MDHRSIQYTEVPELESWTLPCWTYEDVDELDDLLNSLSYYAPESAKETLKTLKTEIRSDSTVAIRLYLGTESPDDATVSFQPVEEPQAPFQGECATGADVLRETYGFMADRGHGEWGRIRTELQGIEKAAIETGSADQLRFSIICP